MIQHSFAALFLAFVAAPLADPYPAYKVAPGTVFERVYKSSTKLESAPAQMFLDGQDVGESGGVVKLRTDDARSMTVTDTIGAVEGGRPRAFTREFDECVNTGTETLLVTPPGASEDVRSTTRERKSLFSGKTVQFAWDADDEKYTAKSEDKALDAEALEGIVGDNDWLCLIEGGPREKGVEFALEAKQFAYVANPLGELRWETDGKESDATGRAIVAQFVENIEGEAHATWQGSREVDGRALSVFALTAKLKSHAEADPSEGKREARFELEYEGEVLWDLEAGRVASYSFEADAHMIQSSTRKVKSPEGEVELRQVFDLTGTTKHSLSVKAR